MELNSPRGEAKAKTNLYLSKDESKKLFTLWLGLGRDPSITDKEMTQDSERKACRFSFGPCSFFRWFEELGTPLTRIALMKLNPESDIGSL